MAEHFDIYTMDNGGTFTDPCDCPIGRDHPEEECQGGHEIEREPAR